MTFSHLSVYQRPNQAMQLTAGSVKQWATIAVAAVLLLSCESMPEQLAPSTSPQAYKKEVLSRMNVVWSVLAPAEIDRLSLGTVKIEFRVQPDGRVSNLKIVANSGNEALAEVARRTVLHTRIPAIPQGVLAQLPAGYMPGDCTFTIYPQR